jgi:hypothetical protein
MAAGLSVDLGRWRLEFDELMLRIGGRFGRVEPQRRMAAFVCGLLAGLPRVNCWTIAEHAGDAGPRGMQRLLSAAVWDEAGVRDDLRGYVLVISVPVLISSGGRRGHFMPTCPRAVEEHRHGGGKYCSPHRDQGDLPARHPDRGGSVGLVRRRGHGLVS